MTRSSAAPIAIVVTSLGVGVGAGVVAWAGGLDGLYGQDPYGYFSYAVGPLRESLRAGTSFPPFFWPPGFPVLVALASCIVGAVPLAGQLVSLAAGSVVPAATIWLGREILTSSGHAAGGTATAILAGVVVALMPQLWVWSALIMADTTALAAATAGMAALARYARTRHGPWLSLSAALLAGAVLSRWAAALIVVPALVAATHVISKLPIAVATRHAGAALLAGLLVLLPVLSTTLDLLTGSAPPGAPFIGDLQVIGWEASNLFRREFVGLDGTLRFQVPNIVYYGAVAGRWFYFTPLLAPFVVLGVVDVVRRRLLLPLLILVGWPAGTLAYLAGMANQNPRFALMAMPPLAICLAIGTQVANAKMGQPRWRNAVRGLVLIGMVWMAVGAVRLTTTFAQRKAEDLAAVRWTEARLPADGRLLTFGITQAFEHYTDLQTINLFSVTTEDVAAVIGEAAPAFVLIDVENVESQWRGRAPAQRFQQLRQDPGLEYVDRFATLTLFRVRHPGR